MNFYGCVLCIPIIFSIATNLSSITDEDKLFLEDLPSLQAEVLGRLLYTFRRFAKKDPAIQSALAVMYKGDYQRRRTALRKIKEFRSLLKKAMHYETLAKIVYFYDPLVYMVDLANEHQDVQPSFSSILDSNEFQQIFEDLTQLTNRTALIFNETLNTDMSSMEEPAIETVLTSPQYHEIVMVWNELGLNIMDQIKLVLADCRYKQMINKMGISL